MKTGTSYIKAEQGVKPREQFAALASEFKNYQYVYVPYSHQLLSAKKKVGLHHSEGLLALSRYPILTHSVLRYEVIDLRITSLKTKEGF